MFSRFEWLVASRYLRARREQGFVSVIVVFSFLGITLGGGLTWMWIGSTIYVALLASILVARFRSGAWKRIRI